ncbi:MAG TPA: hypothetical protein VLA84_07055 [Microcoleus sp.]|nr:hypothetical protein [Microcoleus sp.]
MPTSNQTASCIPQAINSYLTNDPHVEKLGNNYKKADPLTLANQVRPSQPLGKRHRPELAFATKQQNHHT